jgi:hypothetical protein
MARVMTSIVPGNFFREVPGAIDGQSRGVTAAARAIKAGDAERASAAFRSLLHGQGEAVVGLLDQRGLFAPPPAAAAGM